MEVDDAPVVGFENYYAAKIEELEGWPIILLLFWFPLLLLKLA